MFYFVFLRGIKAKCEQSASIRDNDKQNNNAGTALIKWGHRRLNLKFGRYKNKQFQC